MATAYNRSDALGLYLSGSASDGAAQTDPAACLGGFRSSTQLRALGALVSGPIPQVIVRHITGANGAGTALIRTDGAGDYYFTGPSGTEGAAVAIADGETALIEDTDTDMAARIEIDGTALALGATMTLTLVWPVNNVLGMGNVANADRVAGLTTYRALMLYVHSASGVLHPRVWLDDSGCQSTYSIALEAPAADHSIQTIADESTDPIGLSWSEPTTKETGLHLATLGAAKNYGLWIRRVFPPAGTVASYESFTLSLSFYGST